MGGIFSTQTHTHTLTHISDQCKKRKICCFYFFSHETLRSYKKILLQYAHLDTDVQFEQKGKKSHLKTINIVLKPLIDIKKAGNNLQYIKIIMCFMILHGSLPDKPETV